MPSVSEFPEYMANYIIKVAKESISVLDTSAKYGAAYMRSYISADSPTGTVWHDEKNLNNGLSLGARIGNRNAGFYAVDEHSGQMLASVDASAGKRAGSKISSTFGWINDQADYFVEQDAGTYSKNGVGMGLLNGSNSTLQQFGALTAAEEMLKDKMVSTGFKVKG